MRTRTVPFLIVRRIAVIHYEKLLEVAPFMRLPGEKLRKARERIFSPDGFFSWAEEQKMTVRISESATEKDREYLEWNLFVLSRYVAEGERVFRVEPGLGRLLLDTNLPKIIGEEFQLPFPAIYLEFPPNFFITPGLKTPLIGCYLLDMRPIMPAVSLDFVVEPRAETMAVITEFVLHVNLAVEAGSAIQWGNLLEQFARSLRIPQGNLFIRETAAFASEVTEFLVNTLLYATSALPEITEVVSEWRQVQGKMQTSGRKKREELAEKLRRLARTKKYKLGKSIPVTYGAPKATDFSEGARQDRKILKHFQVRGHWRWQVYGPGSSLRKHIFIAPFWKGPKDLAEMLARKYQLK